MSRHFKIEKMKTRIITSVSISILLTILLCAGCTKDTLVGPAGPTGPTGATGPTGNANVEEYDFIVTNTDWLQSGNTWYATYSSVTINKTDAVLVYLNTGASYTQLPYINVTNSIQTYFSNTLNTITVNVNSINNTSIPNPGNETFKIVVIPSTHRMANVNTLNLEEVKTVYHLKGK